ncbi:glycosyltransferase family 2 protein [Methyloversatilis discipulorum]|uniref:glycosyltransferase family 2 protein n=1 Tax=Methyloversatilis discipulorum TaxID=1119528 RepID=UPI0009DB79C9|nr:glycosyltransferase family 2 protein [Methyloversatilis discipulorum]
MISVVTPTRNDLEYLRRCVGSVRGQGGANFEHIIQDSCSTDGTGDWLRSQSDLRGAIEKDDGMYDAINRGWVKSSGEILSWLNADEQYLPGTLEKVRAFFAKNKEIDFAYGDVLIVDASGNPISARREPRLSHFYVRNKFLYTYSCATFFRRNLLDKGLLHLNCKYRYAADMDLILGLLSKGVVVKRIPEYLSLFTMDGSNLSCSPKMLDETEEIRRIHGASSLPLVRRVATLGRYLERLVCGCLAPVNVRFSYAVDEVPNYQVMTGADLPASYATNVSLSSP